MAFVSREQFEAIKPDDECDGGVYLPIRLTAAGKFQMPLFTRPSDTDWQDISTAPKDRFILLYCAEDKSRWLAKWQGERWRGVDELGLTRVGHSAGDPEVVTGWAVNAWQGLPAPPTQEDGR